MFKQEILRSYFFLFLKKLLIVTSAQEILLNLTHRGKQTKHGLLLTVF